MRWWHAIANCVGRSRDEDVCPGVSRLDTDGLVAALGAGGRERAEALVVLTRRLGIRGATQTIRETAGSEAVTRRELRLLFEIDGGFRRGHDAVADLEFMAGRLAGACEAALWWTGSTVLDYASLSRSVPAWRTEVLAGTVRARGHEFQSLFESWPWDHLEVGVPRRVEEVLDLVEAALCHLSDVPGGFEILFGLLEDWTGEVHGAVEAAGLAAAV